jgi:tripartite-type tricarboxylate transporter receptor subunit TctC
MTMHGQAVRFGSMCLLATGLAVPTAQADPIADFYHERTVNFVVGFAPGGGADTYARLVARHLGKHIPGHPNFVIRNMQGGNGAIGANYVYNISAKDGSEIGLFAGNILIDPLLGGTFHKYEARKFNWIGAPSSDTKLCVSSPASSFKTLDDVLHREMVTGATGTSTLDFPIAMNNVIGTKFKIVKGYRGSAALRLAMERGEIEGFCGFGFNSLQTTGLKANLIVQVGLTKNAKLPTVPFVMDYAKTEEDRQILRLIFGWLDLERPIAMPPGVPPERVKAMRDAFDQTMKDPELLADAQKLKLSIDPMDGAGVASFVDDVYRTPPAVAAKATKMLGRGQ